MQPAAADRGGPAGAGTSGGQGSTSAPQRVPSRLPPRRATPRPTPAFASNYGQVPLSFTMNVGQSDSLRAAAPLNGPGFGLWLTNSGMTFSVSQRDAQTGQPSGSDVFTLAMSGGNTSGSAQVVPGDLQTGVSNYFSGSDSSKWITDVPQYGEITYDNVYPGINLVLHAASGQDAAPSSMTSWSTPALTRQHPAGLPRACRASSTTTDSAGQPAAGYLRRQRGHGQPGPLPDHRRPAARRRGTLCPGARRQYRLPGQRQPYDSSDALGARSRLSRAPVTSAAAATLRLRPTASPPDADGNTLPDGQDQTVDQLPNSQRLPEHSARQRFSQRASSPSSIPREQVSSGPLTWAERASPAASVTPSLSICPSGDVYVAGQTTSGFPVTAACRYETTFPFGALNAGFVTKLNSTRRCYLVWSSTYYDADAISVNAVAVDTHRGRPTSPARVPAAAAR